MKLDVTVWILTKVSSNGDISTELFSKENLAEDAYQAVDVETPPGFSCSLNKVTLGICIP